MGGWFKNPINSLADLKGLKMRIPGLGGEVMKKLGVNPVLLPAGEIYTALERGTIDATEWVGPALDSMMGFDKAADYYYTGWHEPGSILEITFNKTRWEKLSDEHKAIITAASEEMTGNMLQEFREEVLLIDTLGELLSFYKVADVCIVGGTFSPIGGHNILEPAYFGKPVIYGPNIWKFKDLEDLLEEIGLGFKTSEDDLEKLLLYVL